MNDTIQIETKRCCLCKDEKALDEFHDNKAKKCGKSSQCKLCHTKYAREYYAANSEKISKQQKECMRKRRVDHPRAEMLYAAKRRAIRDNNAFTISLDDLVIPIHCPILGLELKKGTGRGKILASSPSLDKIIPELGYVPGNVQVISNKANSMKRDATLEEIVLLGEWAKRQIAVAANTPVNTIRIICRN